MGKTDFREGQNTPPEFPAEFFKGFVRPGGSGESFEDQSEQVPGGPRRPGGIQEKPVALEEFRFRPVHVACKRSKGFENVRSPQHQVKERVGAGAGIEECVQASNQGKPEFPAFGGQQGKHAGWLAALPVALVSVVDEVTQIPSLVLEGVQEAPGAAAPRIQKTQPPTGIPHDGPVSGPLL